MTSAGRAVRRRRPVDAVGLGSNPLEARKGESEANMLSQGDGIPSIDSAMLHCV